MTVTNATFTIERMLNASPARVFAAYATLEAKSAWFRAPAEIETINRELDFRVGGAERFHARWPSGLITDFQAAYHDIVPDERIILVGRTVETMGMEAEPRVVAQIGDCAAGKIGAGRRAMEWLRGGP